MDGAVDGAVVGAVALGALDGAVDSLVDGVVGGACQRSRVPAAGRRRCRGRCLGIRGRRGCRQARPEQAVGQHEAKRVRAFVGLRSSRG